MINQQYLLDRFDYNPTTGVFKRKATGHVYQTSNTKSGYIHLDCKGKTYTVHRLIWCMQTGEFPKGVIDHIDGNRLNNKWSNLRDVTHSENLHNRPKSKNNSSGIKGVSFDPKRGDWRGEVMINYVTHRTARYSTREKAELALEFLKQDLNKTRK